MERGVGTDSVRIDKSNGYNGYLAPVVREENADLRQAEFFYTKFLQALGIWDIMDEEPKQRTPARVAHAYLEFFGNNLEPINFTTFPVPLCLDGSCDIVSVYDIEFASLCVGPRTRVYGPGVSYKNAYEVVPGDILYTSVGGVLKETTVKSVRATQKRERITIGGANFNVQMSPDHPVMTSRGWIRAGELSAGDTIPWHNPREFNRRRVEVTPGYSLGYVLGALASDGFIESALHKRRVSLRVTDSWFADRFSLHVAESLGLDVPVTVESVQGGFRNELLTMYRVQFFEIDAIDKLLRLFGGMKRWDNQKVPDIVKSDPQIMQGYMDGYFDGDGTSYYDESTGQVTNKLCSNNRSILEEMSQLGVVGSVCTASNGEGFARIPTAGPLTRFTPDPDIEIADLNAWPVDMCEIAYVQREEATGHKPFSFYDFECDPYPSFIGNGVPLHNCAHHHLPFTGQCHIGYLPKLRVAGLSKLPRVVEHLTHGALIQEDVTREIADFLYRELECHGVVVVMEAEHSCMALRGVRKPGHTTRTIATRGVFAKPEGEARLRLFMEGIK